MSRTRWEVANPISLEQATAIAERFGDNIAATIVLCVETDAGDVVAAIERAAADVGLVLFRLEETS